MKIVLIEENDALGEMLSFYLEEVGYDVDWYTYGESALLSLLNIKPDLIIFNLSLPDFNGHELRIEMQKYYRGPMIMLSEDKNTTDIVQALEAGLDDFFYAPFNMKELQARIEAVLRRGLTKSVSTLLEQKQISDQIELNKEKKAVFIDEQLISLTDSEFKILSLIQGNPNIVFSRENLIRSINDGKKLVYDRTIDVHIFNLRKKIEKNPKIPKRIVTVRGIGYVWKEIIS
ncbi:response regulator transcription factor [Alkalihalobacterium sp. APHAB7]